MIDSLTKMLGFIENPFEKKESVLIKKIHLNYNRLKSIDEHHRQRALNACRITLNHDIKDFDALCEAFALIKLHAERSLGLSHRDNQLLAGWKLLSCNLVELETGQGKTLLATLPAGVVALSGQSAHVITANDYLAKRDSVLMSPLYHSLGLTVAHIEQDMSYQQRKKVYEADVVYCSNKQIVFDWLKDIMNVNEPPSLDGDTCYVPMIGCLNYAIIDEADSVLIDDAIQPLVLSRIKEEPIERTSYQHILSLSKSLKVNVDFFLKGGHRGVYLTAKGLSKLESYDGILTGSKLPENLEFYVKSALKALYVLKQNRDYVIKDDACFIVDENTGRLQLECSWQDGLHQFIEVKENIPLTAEKEMLARTTYQQFFNRYTRLCGMTGTASEISKELKLYYQLPTVIVNSFCASGRDELPLVFFANEQIKYQAIIARIIQITTLGRPILIGTGSVEASHYLSDLLSEHRLDHQILNACQDEQEANIIKKAGGHSTITISTNIAGRGTDIQLAEGVNQLGGLHVLLICVNQSSRIDRQLFGRCGRQGQLGSYEMYLSLEDTKLMSYCPRWLLKFHRIFFGEGGSMSHQWSARFLIKICHSRQEKLHRVMRKQLANADEDMRQLLAFSGYQEQTSRHCKARN